ncbi:hypothetical protein [Cohnella yongneupensis]|uniref:Pentapeptide repeat-containing protein n=1 Tax=Cohnella yongneupensis TaxID=425006 RepID=A0ABW0QZV2_9BACL
MSNRFVRLSLFSGFNFTGRRLVFRRGGIAVRDLRVFQFNDILSSFRLVNVIIPGQVTLVLFRDINFQGSFRVFRGSQNVRDLRNFNFNNVTSSFILAGRNLTTSQINAIQSTGIMPTDIGIITG